MNCILLLLLLGCCGGFGCGNNGTSYVSNGGYDPGSSLGNGNNIRSGNSGPGSDCGCADSSIAVAGSDNGFGSDNGCDSDDGIATVSGGPSNWQDYPSIPGRENNGDCEN